jgi:hypothetical protein
MGTVEEAVAKLISFLRRMSQTQVRTATVRDSGRNGVYEVTTWACEM